MNFLKKNRSTMKLKSFLLALGLLTFAFACNNAGQDGQSTDEADQQEMVEETTLQP
jgi:hypothetical protein